MVCCLVCEQNIHAQSHFGVQACRACSAFFRRAITEQRRYKCKYNAKCNVKKDYRKRCRACRLKSCYEAGMRRETEKAESTDSQIQNEENNMPLDNLDFILPEIASTSAHFKLPMFKLLKKSEFDRLQKSGIPLIYYMLDEYFEPFSLLNQEQKIHLFKFYTMKFSFLMNAYHTAKKCPNLDDTRLATHYQYSIDYTNDDHIKYFLSEFENPEKHFNLTLSILKQSRDMSNKFIKQEINGIEFATLAYIMFLMECENFSNIENIIVQQKDQTFKEIHNYYVTNFGYEQGGVKFSNLFHLLDISMNFYSKVIDDLRMATIFLNDFYDVWINMEEGK